MPNSAYWDACLFIDVLQKSDPERLDACMALLDKAKEGELAIVTSALTITEVNKLDDLGTADGISREEQSKLILAFFENPYIVIRPLDRYTAEYAHELTRTFSLKNMDAIHVATAVIAKVDVFYTYDEKKAKRKGLLSHSGKIGNPPLRIEKPPDPDAGTLFEAKESAS